MVWSGFLSKCGKCAGSGPCEAWEEVGRDIRQWLLSETASSLPVTLREEVLREIQGPECPRIEARKGKILKAAATSEVRPYYE